MTLVEVLIDLAVLSMVALAILSAYSSSFRSMTYAKSKLAAVALANEKMEEIRNMPYDSLATQHGPIYPPGQIADDSTIIRNGVELKAHIVISYVDDPFDGDAGGTIAGKPKDLYPYDYKKVEVTIYKSGLKGKLASLTSNVSAKAAETPSNTGIVKLCVIDSEGNPVPEANVVIQNFNTTPPVDIQTVAAEDGCIMVPNLPPSSHNQYHIAANKTGFSLDQTYPRTAQNPNAVAPDIDILLQDVTNATLVIDRVSKMNVSVVNMSGSPVPNHPIHIEGSKLIYNNPDTRKYVADLTTDANGQLELNDMEFDDYTFSLDGLTVASVSPFQPVSLKAGQTLSVRVTTTSNASGFQVKSLSPTAGIVNQTSYISIEGENFTSPSIKIVQGTKEISATNIAIDNKGILSAELDLSGASTGLYDMIITQGGESVTQTGAFEVRN